VPRLLIVPERSRIDLTARPALPGVRLVVDEVSGTVDLDGPGAPTGACSGTGELTVWLQAQVDGGPPADGVPPWLRPGDVVALAGVVEEARGDGRGHLEVRTRFAIDGRPIPLTGAGRAGPPAGDPDGSAALEAVGVSLVDPRTLGFALPPLVTYAIHARWRLVLTPAP
jgi:hypothetical protein